MATASVQHVFSSPKSDGPHTDLLQPSHWNATHAVTVDGVVGTNFAGTNITGTLNSAGISLSVAAPGAVSWGAIAGTLSNQTDLQGAFNNKADTGHTHSQYINTSVSSDFQPVSGMSNYQSAGAYLTTQTVQTQGTFDSNNLSNYQQTSGTSAITALAFPSANTTKFAGLGTTTAATNANVTLNVGTNGVAISVSANAGGAGGAAIQGSGTYTQNTGTVQFANGNNVTFGLATNGIMTASASVAAGGGDGWNPIAAGGSTGNSTQSIVFGNANGVSFSLNGSTITASHNGLTDAAAFIPAANSTAYQTSVLSNTFAQTNALTTAMASNAARVSQWIAGSVTQNGSNNQILFTGSNGISVHGNGSTISVSLLDIHHLDGFAASGNNNGTGFSAMTSGTLGMNFAGDISASQNGNNFTISAPAQTVQPAVGQLNGSSGTMSFVVGSSLSASSNASTITFGLASNITTALMPLGNSTAYQTSVLSGTFFPTANSSNLVAVSRSTEWATSVLSNTFSPRSNVVGVQSVSTVATAGSLMTGSAGSAGITLAVPAYLTAAAGGGATVTVSGSNGTIQSNGLSFLGSGGVSVYTTTGSQIVVAQAAGGAANAYLSFAGANTAGNTTASGTGFQISGINLTLSGTNNSQYAISAPAVSVISGGGNVTVGTNGSTITISAGAGRPAYWAVPEWVGANALITNVTALDKRAFFQPFEAKGVLSAQELMFPMSKVTSNQDAVFTAQMGIYSYVNSSSIALISSTQNVFSAGSSLVAARSIALWEMEYNGTYVSLNPGQYVLGVWFSANGGATSGMNFSLMGPSTASWYSNILQNGTNNSFNHVSHMGMPFLGRHSVTTGSIPTDMIAADMIGAFTGTSHPLMMNWTLGTHN